MHTAQAINHLVSRLDCALGIYQAGSCHVLAETTCCRLQQSKWWRKAVAQAARYRFQKSRQLLWHKERERSYPLLSGHAALSADSELAV